MSEGFKPASVFSVAEVIACEAIERGWTRYDVAVRMTREAADIQKNLLGLGLIGLQKSDILLGDDGAAELERAFGIGAHFWLRTEELWRAHPDAQTPFSDDSQEADWFGLNESVNVAERAP